MENYNSLEEAVYAAKNGNQDAFTYLYNQTYWSKYYIVMKYINNEQDAKDVLQESYMKAFSYIGTITDYSSFSAWLSKIVSNTALNKLKKKQPALFSDMATNDVDDSFFYDVVDERTSYNPEAAYSNQETVELVRALLEELTPEQKVSIIMFHLEGFSIKDIADSMNCNENTVKSRLVSGRKVLRKKCENLTARGYKLYGMAPIPLLIYLLKQEAYQSNIMLEGGKTITGMVAGQAASNQAAIGQAANNQTAIGQAANNQTAIGQSANNQTAIGQSANNQTAIGQSANNQLTGAQVAGEFSNSNITRNAAASNGARVAVGHGVMFKLALGTLITVIVGGLGILGLKLLKSSDKKSKENLNGNPDEILSVESTTEDNDILIPNEKTGTKKQIVFGAYEQDGNTKNGEEPIVWDVLEDKDGELLIVSHYALYWMTYNKEAEETTWETCTARKSLNGFFYEEAFQDDERASILKKTIETRCVQDEDDPDYGKIIYTDDYVFFLSLEDLNKYYNFNYWEENHRVGWSEELMVEPTPAAREYGIVNMDVTYSDYAEYMQDKNYSDANVGKNYTKWWLRNSAYIDYACYVGILGNAGEGVADGVEVQKRGVRPAMYVKYNPDTMREATEADLIFTNDAESESTEVIGEITDEAGDITHTIFYEIEPMVTAGWRIEFDNNGIVTYEMIYEYGNNASNTTTFEYEVLDDQNIVIHNFDLWGTNENPTDMIFYYYPEDRAYCAAKPGEDYCEGPVPSFMPCFFVCDDNNPDFDALSNVMNGLAVKYPEWSWQ